MWTYKYLNIFFQEDTLDTMENENKDVNIE